MNLSRNKITLGIVLIVIACAIWYLDSLKAKPVGSGNVVTVQSSPVGNNPSGFINTDPFKIQDLIGKKVILIDFWTYSCINCQRTLPYVTSWYNKYKDDGLVVIGVHTPEFEFEHDINNVTAATKKFGVKYPVVLDNNYGTWSAYQNQYWPAEYLIDIDGFITHTHFGEGDYDVTEKAIQDALAERAQVLGEKTAVPTDMVNPNDVTTVNSQQLGSPETYFGSARNQYLGNGTSGKAGVQNFTQPQPVNPNTLYLAGNWNIADQYAQNTEAGASISYKYQAKNVYFVAGSDTPVQITVIQDGKQLKTITVQQHTLYNLVENADYGQHNLQLLIQSPNLQAFTFTFG
jgi:thiol-disulfide isomerase/thioredoxin